MDLPHPTSVSYTIYTKSGCLSCTKVKDLLKPRCWRRPCSATPLIGCSHEPSCSPATGSSTSPCCPPRAQPSTPRDTSKPRCCCASWPCSSPLECNCRISALSQWRSISPFRCSELKPASLSATGQMYCSLQVDTCVTVTDKISSGGFVWQTLANQFFNASFHDLFPLWYGSRAESESG